MREVGFLELETMRRVSLSLHQRESEPKGVNFGVKNGPKIKFSIVEKTKKQ